MLLRGEPLFFLIIVDDRAFTVEGPMVSNTGWVAAVRDARKAGRKVRCFNTQINTSMVAYQQQGLQFRNSGSIVRPAMIEAFTWGIREILQAPSMDG